MTNNITFTNNAKRVTLASTNVDYTINNELGIILSIPSTDTAKVDNAKIGNLLKILERWTINGYIITGLANQTGPPVERTNAADVKADLIEMCKRRGATTMNYDGVDYSVYFEKISIKEAAQDLDSEAPDGVVRYDVQLSVLYGESLF